MSTGIPGAVVAVLVLLAIAAGYRSESRYIVFQCLKHTLDFPNENWRVLGRRGMTGDAATFEFGYKWRGVTAGRRNWLFSNHTRFSGGFKRAVF